MGEKAMNRVATALLHVGRTHRHALVACGLLLGQVAWSQVPAQGSGAWGLNWSAPPACINSIELGRRVEETLARRVFGDRPQYLIDGKIETGAAGYLATLSLINEGGKPLGTRQLKATDQCRSIDDTLAFVIAVMIDPSVAQRRTAPSSDALPQGTPLAATENSDAPLSMVTGLGIVVESNHPSAELWQLAPGGERRLCGLPCEVATVDPSLPLLARGKGIASSEPFSLADRTQPVRVVIRAGAASDRTSGRVMLGFGIAFLAGGIAMMGMGIAGVSANTSFLSSSYFFVSPLGSTLLLALCPIPLLSGIPLTIGGAIMLDNARKTRVFVYDRPGGAANFRNANTI